MSNLPECDLHEIQEWSEWKDGDGPLDIAEMDLGVRLADAALAAVWKATKWLADRNVELAERLHKAEAELECIRKAMRGYADSDLADLAKTLAIRSEMCDEAEADRDREHAAWIESAAESEGRRQKLMEVEAEIKHLQSDLADCAKTCGGLEYQLKEAEAERDAMVRTLQDCGNYQSYRMFIEQRDHLEAERESLRLELAASESNHKKDTEYLVAALNRARERCVAELCETGKPCGREQP